MSSSSNIFYFYYFPLPFNALAFLLSLGTILASLWKKYEDYNEARPVKMGNYTVPTKAQRSAKLQRELYFYICHISNLMIQITGSYALLLLIDSNHSSTLGQLFFRLADLFLSIVFFFIAYTDAKMLRGISSFQKIFRISHIAKLEALVKVMFGVTFTLHIINLCVGFAMPVIPNWVNLLIEFVDLTFAIYVIIVDCIATALVIDIVRRHTATAPIRSSTTKSVTRPSISERIRSSIKEVREDKSGKNFFRIIVVLALCLLVEIVSAIVYLVTILHLLEPSQNPLDLDVVGCFVYAEASIHSFLLQWVYTRLLDHLSPASSPTSLPPDSTGVGEDVNAPNSASYLTAGSGHRINGTTGRNSLSAKDGVGLKAVSENE